MDESGRRLLQGGKECKEREAKAEGKSLLVEILKHHCPLHPDISWKKRNAGPPENVRGLQSPRIPRACGSQIWLAVRMTGRTFKNRNNWVPSSPGIKLVRDIGMLKKIIINKYVFKKPKPTVDSGC